MATPFTVGLAYTREQVANAINLPEELLKGDWLTGYREWNGEVFVFANIGVPGRTGHDYSNRWDGKNLIWFSKGTAQLGQPKIDRIVSNTVPVHVFWRGADRSPFTYAGTPLAVRVDGANPVKVVWSFESIILDRGPDALAAKSNVWRRGPPPTIGDVKSTRTDGATDVYLLRLVGPVEAVLNVAADCSVIKVGMSANVPRRLIELNAGFPPGSKLCWEKVRTKTFGTSEDAYAYEGMQLENLRRDGHWIGGEFAMVTQEAFRALVI